MSGKFTSRRDRANDAARNVMGKIIPHEFYSLITSIDSELDQLGQADSDGYHAAFISLVRQALKEISVTFHNNLKVKNDIRLRTVIEYSNQIIQPKFYEVERLATLEGRKVPRYSKQFITINEVRYQSNRGTEYLEGIVRLLQSLDTQANSQPIQESLSRTEAPVNLKQLVGRVERRLLGSATHARTPISASNKLPTVIGDDALIFTVFRNLVSNGLKYRQRGRGSKVWVLPFNGGLPSDEFWAIELKRSYEKRIEKLLEREDNAEVILNRQNSVKIAVLDNGRGIDSKVIGRIFRPLNRGSEGYASIPKELSDINDKGLGVGLTAAQWAMKMHGGDITVSSKLGLGSIFVVAFPKERLYRWR